MNLIAVGVPNVEQTFFREIKADDDAKLNENCNQNRTQSMVMKRIEQWKRKQQNNQRKRRKDHSNVVNLGLMCFAT